MSGLISPGGEVAEDDDDEPLNPEGKLYWALRSSSSILLILWLAS